MKNPDTRIMTDSLRATLMVHAVESTNNEGAFFLGGSEDQRHQGKIGRHQEEKKWSVEYPRLDELIAAQPNTAGFKPNG